MFCEMKTCIHNKKRVFGDVFDANLKLPRKRAVGLS